MKILLLILIFLSNSCLAEEQNECSKEQLITFANAVSQEIRTNSHYPRIALRRNEQGWGIITVDFDINWVLTTMQVAKSTGSDSLDDGMRLAINKSKFIVPSCKTKMPTRIFAPIRFTLSHTKEAHITQDQLPYYEQIITNP